MKVALIYRFYIPSFGGIEVLIHTIGRGLIYYGLNPYVITLRYDKSLLYRDEFNGVTVVRLNAKRFLMNQIDTGIDANKLRNFLKDMDIVHVFSSLPSSILMHSLRQCNKMNKICLWQPVFIPGRFNYHRSILVKVFGKLWDRFYLPRLARYPQGIIALSNAEAEFFRRVSKDSIIEVLGECVEEVKVGSSYVERVLAKYGLERESYLLSVGRLVWYKGYDLLINAWRSMERKFGWLKLVIVGSDWGYKRIILSMVKKYGLRNVVLLKDIPFLELHALYEASLAVVQLSRFETFHRVSLEAWSHRKPIVALDLGPATEHISPDAGILVRDNVQEIEEAITRLVTDEKLRHGMGERGYVIFKSKYNVESYVRRLLNIYGIVGKR
ncbi:MAG: glycosyltransferase family 4 protein [Desulfurococcales archaeon]|nr:glycosyltransferase family 4 protein [Desulfurococcales archaeon]